MNIINRLFKRPPKDDEPEDVLKIAKTLGPLIDNIVNDVFMQYQLTLLNEPIVYIVPAVWGAKKKGELDTTQKEIHKQIEPILDKIFATLNLKGLSETQKFAVMFLIRGLIISKITYMIEALKNCTVDITSQENDAGLAKLEPMGNA